MKPREIERHQPQPNQAVIVLRVEPTLFWLRGHFDLQPILPGVAQLDWVMHYASALLTTGWRFHGIQNIKFQSPLLPDSTVTLTIDWQLQSQLLGFGYQRHEGATRHNISSGKIRLCP